VCEITGEQRYIHVARHTQWAGIWIVRLVAYDRIIRLTDDNDNTAWQTKDTALSVAVWWTNLLQYVVIIDD